jgi:hypothetical protein
VFVNEHFVGTAPLKSVVDLMPGPYAVRAGDGNAAGSVDASQTVEIKLQGARVNTAVNVVLRMDPKAAPKALPIVSNADDAPGGKRAESASAGRFAGPIALGALGVIGIGAGIGFGAANRSSIDAFGAAAASSPCANPASVECTQQQGRIDDASTQATISWASYAVGASALVGAAIWTALVWSPTKKEHAAHAHFDVLPLRTRAARAIAVADGFTFRISGSF